jgi:hypothetical protein
MRHRPIQVLNHQTVYIVLARGCTRLEDARLELVAARKKSHTKCNQINQLCSQMFERNGASAIEEALPLYYCSGRRHCVIKLLKKRSTCIHTVIEKSSIHLCIHKTVCRFNFVYWVLKYVTQIAIGDSSPWKLLDELRSAGCTQLRLIAIQSR